MGRYKVQVKRTLFSSTQIRFSFLLVNLIFWAVGFSAIGFSTWCFIFNPETVHQITGSEALTYLLLILAVLGFAAGLSGCCGGVRIHLSFIYAFICLTITSILFEGFIVVYLFLLEEDERFYANSVSTWLRLEESIRNSLQYQYDCCGFEGPLDYMNETSLIDISCYNSSMEKNLPQFKLHKDGCKSKIPPGSTRQKNMDFYALSLGAFLSMQLLGLLTAVALIRRIHKRERTVNSDENSDDIKLISTGKIGNSSKNKKYRRIKRIVRVHKGVRILKSNLKNGMEKFEFQSRT